MGIELELIGWSGYILTLIGVIILAVKQVVPLQVWLIFIGSNVFWILYDVILLDTKSGVRNVTLLISNFVGIWQWYRMRKRTEE